MGLLHPGRKVDINYPDMEGYPISVLVTGTVRVLAPLVQILEGELVPYRTKRIVQFQSDTGRRTVELAHLTVR